MGMSLLLIGVISAVIGGLLLAEISAWSPKVSGLVALFAARRMSIHQRARFKEEWLAYLEEMPTA